MPRNMKEQRTRWDDGQETTWKMGEETRWEKPDEMMGGDLDGCLEGEQLTSVLSKEGRSEKVIDPR